MGSKTTYFCDVCGEKVDKASYLAPVAFNTASRNGMISRKFDEVCEICRDRLAAAIQKVIDIRQGNSFSLNVISDENNEEIYVIKSRTTPGKTYNVTLNKRTGQYTCECKGFEYRGYCSHIETVKNDFNSWGSNG